MKQAPVLRHEFVEFLPETLKEGVVYISLSYATASHKCCCGCGNVVVTPITPTDWKLTFDGETISLYPSIGNWSFPCRSHYWIRQNQVEWADSWSEEEVESGRANDKAAKQKFYGTRSEQKTPKASEARSKSKKKAPTWLEKLGRLFS
jgi:hypothetical protein